MIRKIIKEKTKNVITEKYFNESGKARLQQILNGVVPNIYTIGIITAENPLRKNLSSSENKKLNDKLERWIKDGNWGYIKVIGKYDNIENPFIIYNINNKNLIEMAKAYNQEAFIFGLKYENNEEMGMKFSYVSQNVKKNEFSFKYEGDYNYQVLYVRKFYIRMDDPDNYYTQHKGFKFQIPFFDEELKDFERLNGKIKKISYTESEMNSTEELKKLYKEYVKFQKDSDFMEKHYEEYTGKSRWVARGGMRVIKYKIEEILK